MNPSLRSLAVIEDRLTGCLRGILGSFHAVAMPVHFVPAVGVEELLADSLHDVLPIILAVATIVHLAPQIFRKPSIDRWPRSRP